ncbi:hypothetical protein ABL78_5011 [Leptomonas seymouri]|uniref:Rhodanese domain-containing protein n=1 Tax=Leptomonas seymouri TaxID=5684 RepID=A0A0N0P5F3_LEPSE|nr:hypothetical protein ABL78_5011 [Leptomonas seymouri]|eukprot:KPI85927.1 hypothetical protein ABL78_5011 [Leptomonas seymouri]
MSLHPVIGDKDVLQRRPAPHKKFSSVQAVVESGATAQVAQYVKENRIKTKQQPGEFFKRIRTDTVANYIRSQEPKVALEDGGFARPMDEYGGAESGEGKPKIDYLLVDCRDLEHYDTCHIKNALHYVKVRLHHATSPFLPEMYTFKNKENKMIVLYDLEEEVVASIANTMFQKGIDNVSIIAGGLREFAQDYEEMLTGPSPVPIVPRDMRMKRRADEATLARSEARSTMSHKPKGLSSSLARPVRKSTF